MTGPQCLKVFQAPVSKHLVTNQGAVLDVSKTRWIKVIRIKRVKQAIMQCSDRSLAAQF